MLLLYPLNQQNNTQQESHLHSIMLLLYRILWKETYLNICIYIPLCFYFIRSRTCMICCARINLHSIMLLLYPGEAMKSVVEESNLHSIMLLLYPEPGATRKITVTISTFHYASTLSQIPPGSPPCRPEIYIPLCFYFILFRCCAGRSDHPSTFHYASTLSGLLADKTGNSYIYIPLCFYFIYYRNLRSEWGISIYIPLCFYFIKKP